MMRAALLFATAMSVGSAAHAAEAPKPIPKNTYAQHLVDQTLTAHPQVLVLAMHATPPGAKDNVIVASNIGRIGKKADPDDLEVIRSGQPKLEINKTGDRFEVEEPLKDVGGETIGALGVVFPYHRGDDQQARKAQADAIRDQLARRIAHAGNLVDPWPYDPKVSDRTYAQTLVDATLKRHPEILILAVHSTPPGSKVNMITGSNIGRIGKPADEDDRRVIEKGAINREVNETGKRFEAELPLNDAHGKRIGALGVVFAYQAGEDKEALVKKAEKIRDEMAAKIASSEALAKPVA
jgi:hypothetical protein